MRKSASQASVGTVLRELRQAAGLSQSALARRAGIAASHLSQLEGQRRGNPRFETVAAVAVALGVSLDYIASQCGFGAVGKLNLGDDKAARVAAAIATSRKHLEQALTAQDRAANLVTLPRRRKQ